MPESPQIFAHRGAKSVAPENTLPAFEAALAMGVDGIELDVQCSRDNELVVIHNFDVDATTDGDGPVSSLTAAELNRLDAGSHFSAEFAGAGVPTLAQVLDLVGKRCLVNIEIKSLDVTTGGYEVEPLLEIISRHRLYDQVLVSSFNPITLLKLRWLDEDVALGVLHGPEQPLYLRNAWASDIVAPGAFHPHFSALDPAYMEWARSHGFDVNTWTVNDVAQAEHLANMGVNTIISDLPDQLIAALRP